MEKSTGCVLGVLGVLKYVAIERPVNSDWESIQDLNCHLPHLQRLFPEHAKREQRQSSRRRIDFEMLS